VFDGGEHPATLQADTRYVNVVRRGTEKSENLVVFAASVAIVWKLLSVLRWTSNLVSSDELSAHASSAVDPFSFAVRLLGAAGAVAGGGGGAIVVAGAMFE